MKNYKYGQCEFIHNKSNENWDIFYHGVWQNTCESIKKCRTWIHEKRMQGKYPVILK